jgi:hypothetical protein
MRRVELSSLKVRLRSTLKSNLFLVNDERSFSHCTNILKLLKSQIYNISFHTAQDLHLFTLHKLHIL